MPDQTVVEEAPSHDGAPRFSAYKVAEGNSRRPRYALVVYDTTPSSTDPEYIRDLAVKIHDGTYEERITRNARDQEVRDRIEVVGLPWHPDLGEKTRITEAEEGACVQRCKAHHLAEVAARNATGSTDFYLPKTCDGDYNYRIFIIYHLHPGWESVVMYRKRVPNPPEFDVLEGSSYDFDDIDSTREDYETNPYGGILDVEWGKTENRLYLEQHAYDDGNDEKDDDEAEEDEEDEEDKKDAEAEVDEGDSDENKGREDLFSEFAPIEETCTDAYPVACLAMQFASMREYIGAFLDYIDNGSLAKEMQAACPGYDKGDDDSEREIGSGYAS